MKLHEFHARSLESSLTLADASVHRMERLLTDGGEEGVVRTIENTLSPELRATLLRFVRTLREMLAAMAESFSRSVRTKRRSVARNSGESVFSIVRTTPSSPPSVSNLSMRWTDASARVREDSRLLA